jgi:excisionase family DNA binding protein
MAEVRYPAQERASAASPEAVKHRKRASFLGWLAEGGLPGLTGPEGRTIAPGAVDAESAARALRGIKDCLAHATRPGEDVRIHTEIGDGAALVLPRPTVELFAAILADLAGGQGVQLVPVNAEVSTQLAAEMLNVSRPSLIGLLERGEMPYRIVGRHRRVRLDDLVAYQRTDDRRRKDAPGELTRLDQELGLG